MIMVLLAPGRGRCCSLEYVLRSIAGRPVPVGPGAFLCADHRTWRGQPSGQPLRGEAEPSMQLVLLRGVRAPLLSLILS